MRNASTEYRHETSRYRRLFLEVSLSIKLSIDAYPNPKSWIARTNPKKLDRESPSILRRSSVEQYNTIHSLSHANGARNKSKTRVSTQFPFVGHQHFFIDACSTLSVKKQPFGRYLEGGRVRATSYRQSNIASSIS